MMMSGALLIGGTAYAQTDGNSGATQRVQVENKECNGGKQCENCPQGEKKGNKKDHKKGAKSQVKGLRQTYKPFDGIQLTPDQQQKLLELQQGLGPVALTPEMKEKIKENPNLSSQEKKQLKEEKKAKKIEKKKNYLKGVKEILTPDQYVMFLENVYLYSPEPKVNVPARHFMKPQVQEEKGDKKVHKGSKEKGSKN